MPTALEETSTLLRERHLKHSLFVYSGAHLNVLCVLSAAFGCVAHSCYTLSKCIQTLSCSPLAFVPRSSNFPSSVPLQTALQWLGMWYLWIHADLDLFPPVWPLIRTASSGIRGLEQPVNKSSCWLPSSTIYPWDSEICLWGACLGQ